MSGRASRAISAGALQGTGFAAVAAGSVGSAAFAAAGDAGAAAAAGPDPTGGSARSKLEPSVAVMGRRAMVREIAKKLLLRILVWGLFFLRLGRLEMGSLGDE